MELVSFFSPWILIELTRENIWPWCFLFWEVINYWFNIFSRHRPIQVSSMYFTLHDFWQFYVFQDINLSQLTNLHTQNCWQYFLITPLIYKGWEVAILLSYLILGICLSLLICLQVYQFYWCLQKNQISVLLFFSTEFILFLWWFLKYPLPLHSPLSIWGMTCRWKTSFFVSHSFL